MKNILIIVFSDLKYDARVNRQVQWLQSMYHVAVMSYGNEHSHLEHIQLRQPKLTLTKKLLLAVLLLLKQFSKAYWLLYPYKSLKEKIKNQPDLIVANDVEALPLAFQIAEPRRIPVYFDAHEYAPRHFEDKLWFRLFFQKFNLYLCQKYLPKISGMSTVSPGLLREYKKNFPVDPVLILNAPKYYDLIPQKTQLPIKIIHQGGATISRKIENMIEMMSYLDDNYHLDLMLLIPPRASNRTREYINKLKELASNNPRVRFVPPVEHDKVVDAIKEYDIGLFLLEPVNFNYTYTVPNKLLEFIQARLAVAIGPSPDMQSIVEEYTCGIVSKNFTPQSLAEKIKGLTITDIDQLKNNSSIAASKLNADFYKKKFLGEIEKILLKIY